MSFLTDISEEFEDILTGEFSVRIILISRATGEECDTRGIYDKTLEVFEKEGVQVNTVYNRVTIPVNSLTFVPEQYDVVRVYDIEEVNYTEYKIYTYDPESEGAAVIPLIQDD